MVDFAVRWLQWNGGPDTEIFIRFGIGSDEYYQRLTTAIENDSRLLSTCVRTCGVCAVRSRRRGRFARTPVTLETDLRNE